MRNILHTPFNHCNLAKNISIVERLKGYKSRVEVLDDCPFHMLADRNWTLNRYKLLSFMRWPLIIYALLFFDTINYHSNYLAPSLIPERGRLKIIRKLRNFLIKNSVEAIDLKLFKFFKKKITVTFYGSDVRQVGYAKKNYKWHFSHEKLSLHNDTEDYLRKRRVSQFDKYADVIFTVTPDIFHSLPKRAVFLPYCYRQYPLPQLKPPPLSNSDPIIIGHAPSDANLKGTIYLKSAVNQLINQGYNVRLELIENVKNNQLIPKLAKVDILVDQLMLGYYGIISIEAMYLSKPVISFIFPGFIKLIPEEMQKELPIISANKHDIKSKIESLLNNKNKIIELGKKSKKYVTKWHSPDYAINYFHEKIKEAT